MAQSVYLPIVMPGNLRNFRLPVGVQRRLAELLDRQDHGQPLTVAERREAEGLVEMAELLSLLKSKARKVARSSR